MHKNKYVKAVLFIALFSASIFLFSHSAQAAGEPGPFRLWLVSTRCDMVEPIGPAVLLDWEASAGATRYEVYRNGMYYTNTATDTFFDNTINLLAGHSYDYYILAKNAFGETASNTITVHVDDNICSVGTGTLNVTSSPAGATVYIDNVERGATPITLNNISAGSHSIRITKSGYQEYQGTISITVGGSTPFSVSLTPLTPACRDGSDNDNDGATDAADCGCHTDGVASNVESYNPEDASEGGFCSSTVGGEEDPDAGNIGIVVHVNPNPFTPSKGEVAHITVENIGTMDCQVMFDIAGANMHWEALAPSPTMPGSSSPEFLWNGEGWNGNIVAPGDYTYTATCTSTRNSAGASFLDKVLSYIISPVNAFYSDTETGTITVLGEGDTQAPELIYFDLEPKTVDLSNLSNEECVPMNFSFRFDDESEFGGASLRFVSVDKDRWGNHQVVDVSVGADNLTPQVESLFCRNEDNDAVGNYLPFSFSMWDKKGNTFSISEPSLNDGIVAGEVVDYFRNKGFPAGFEVVKNISQIDPLILKYEPFLYFHPDENFEPMNVEPYVKHSSLWDISGVDELVPGVSNPLSLDDLVSSEGTSDWYLQFTDSTEPKSPDAAAATREYKSMTNDEKKPTYYARKMEDAFIDDEGYVHRYTVLQYWYFYAFNDWKEQLGDDGYNNHEGDWESVFIFLDKETEKPKYVAYSAHHNQGEKTLIKSYDSVRRRWDSNEVEKDLNDPNHVKSFVALGSHANYPKNEGGSHDVKVNLYVLGKDLTSSGGVKKIIASDWNNREIVGSLSPEWIYEYKGKWGADTTDMGFDGPQGPYFCDVSGIIRFREPIKWAGIDKISEKTTAEPTNAVYFGSQLAEIHLGKQVPIGTNFSVDLHDEHIIEGANLEDLTFLPHFWDIESSLENDTFNATTTFRYNPDEVQYMGVIENDLSVFYFNPTSSVWEDISSRLDATNNTISFTTAHFSRYAIGVRNWESVSDKLEVKKSWGAYDPKTGKRQASIRLRNISEETIPGELRILFTDLKEDLNLINKIGGTVEGIPFIDIELKDGLSPKEYTESIELQFLLQNKKTVPSKDNGRDWEVIISDMQDLNFSIDILQRKT